MNILQYVRNLINWIATESMKFNVKTTFIL